MIQIQLKYTCYFFEQEFNISLPPILIVFNSKTKKSLNSYDFIGSTTKKVKIKLCTEIKRTDLVFCGGGGGDGCLASSSEPLPGSSKSSS